MCTTGERRLCRRKFAFALLAVGFLAGECNSADQDSSTLPMPHFRYETDWLKLPAGLAMGEVVAVAVDRKDHVWVLHRYRTVKDRDPADVAPPITEFDNTGKYLRGFGGPGNGYEWPASEHSIAVTDQGDIWIGGNNRDEAHGDDMLLVFDSNSRFVRQFGQRGASEGNFDEKNFHAPGDIFIDERANEVYVADGYVNQRVVVLDKSNGQFKRMWGAFGTAPPRERPTSLPQAQVNEQGSETATIFKGLHAVERARDGFVYVSDRGNERIQAFTPTGAYVGQVSANRSLPSALTASGITFSKDRAQRYLFVADWGNGMIVVIDRKALKTVGTIGKQGTAPGEFTGPHLIDTDSKGVIYVAEVQGRRLQRLIPAARKQRR